VPEAATICLRPLQVDNIFVFVRQVAPVPACWLFKTSATSLRLTLTVVSVVSCDVGYLCANFSLIGLSILELGSIYATDVRQTSDEIIA